MAGILWDLRWRLPEAKINKDLKKIPSSHGFSAKEKKMAEVKRSLAYLILKTKYKIVRVSLRLTNGGGLCDSLMDLDETLELASPEGRQSIFIR